MKIQQSMFQRFGLTDVEFDELHRKFGDLCRYAAWQLKRRNAQNNLIDTDIEDIIQDLLIALIYAGVYYKRQVFIEECLVIADEHVRDQFVRQILNELKELWANRTKHGAGKKKFGEYQERILECIIATLPIHLRPSRESKLQIDKKFTTYCKQITWNRQRSLGRKITKERAIRSAAVSLSDYEYLGAL